MATGSFLGDLALSAVSPIVNTVGSLVGFNMQKEAQKELLDYQQEKYLLPKAQVKNLAEAGINPAVAFGNSNSVVTSGGSYPSIQAPQIGIGTTDLNALANYIKSVADAKKAGMDTKLTEQDIKNKEIERQINEFELSLKKEFGKDFQSVSLAQAYRNLLLASDSHDINEQQKALNEWNIAISKSEHGIKESEREMVRQRLENNPTAIRLENELMKEKSKSERASQSASYASAEASKAAAMESFARTETENMLRYGRVNEQILENGLKALDYDIKNLTQLETINQIKDEAARIHRQLTHGEALGKWAPDLRGTEIRVPVLTDIEEALTKLWLKYKYNVDVSKKKLEDKKNSK